MPENGRWDLIRRLKIKDTACCSQTQQAHLYCLENVALHLDYA